MIKKILLYYPSFEKGGATQNLINIVNYFLKNKIEIFLFSHKANKKYFFKSNYLKIINSKPIKYMNFLPLRWNLALSSAFNLNNHSKSTEKSSIIFSMQSHIPAIIISKFNKKKISIRNSEEPLGATYYADNRFLALLVLVLKFFFYNLTDQIIAISEKSEESLKKIVIFKKKIILILNPYLKKILKIKKKKKSKKFSILSVGRITKQKNFDLLIDSVSNLSKKYKNIDLTIVGNGDLFKHTCDKIFNKKNIKLIKWKKNLKPFFLKSDLFVLSSYYEGLPNVLIDAVNYEIPCLATDVSGVRDILIKGKGGLIIPNNDQDKLEKNIEYSLKNYSKLKKMALIAKNKIFRFTNINCVLMHKQFNKIINFK
ncbi:glycosyltransferase [Pelagibacterales bacterium SAG-MED19]|nr:glycosyltransferase [Pelagibacterales bacterium SAG-MED19]